MENRPGTSPPEERAVDAAASAAKSAGSAAASATQATRAAMDAEIAAAVTAAVAHATGPLLAELAELKKDEAADDQQAQIVENTVSGIQAQLIWVSCVMLLVGATIGHILELAFG